MRSPKAAAPPLRVAPCWPLHAKRLRCGRPGAACTPAVLLPGADSHAGGCAGLPARRAPALSGGACLSRGEDHASAARLCMHARWAWSPDCEGHPAGQERGDSEASLCCGTHAGAAGLPAAHAAAPTSAHRQHSHRDGPGRQGAASRQHSLDCSARVQGCCRQVAASGIGRPSPQLGRLLASPWPLRRLQLQIIEDAAVHDNYCRVITPEPAINEETEDVCQDLQACLNLRCGAPRLPAWPQPTDWPVSHKVGAAPAAAATEPVRAGPVRSLDFALTRPSGCAVLPMITKEAAPARGVCSRARGAQAHS